MPTSTAMPLYILDTNIWLDWLVFQTDVLDPLKAQHAAGKMTLIFTDDMLIELTDVIGRAQFKLSQAQQQTALARFHQLAVRVDTRAKPAVPIRCKDADDQVFIDQALAHRATWLLSKDKHLLSLRSRAAKQQVWVGTIADWLRTQKDVL
jgi:putative PIN family toxin of toxin-antitoxin system